MRKKVKSFLLTPEEASGSGAKFKRSGHLTDQILKYSYPKDGSSQLSIFDELLDGTKKEIEVSGVQFTEIVEGIRLSGAETKIIDCLCKLLHEKSQTTEPGSPKYYAGNVPAVKDPKTDTLDIEVSGYGGGIATASKLGTTLYQLTKEYKGGESVSGKDVDNVSKILYELSNKKFLLRYKEETRNKDGTKRVREIELFHPIIALPNYKDILYSKEGVELSKEEETLIILHPIFKRQIDSKFILYPADITRRTIIANGSHNLSDITVRLRDYLMRELTYKRYTPEIGLEKLYYLLAERWMKQHRKRLVKSYTEKAIQTVKDLGLLVKYELAKGSSGEPKMIFYLNEHWQ